MFKQFIDDMVHMTEGEKLIHYWPLWLGILIIAIGFILFVKGSGKR
jgi:hypothetical protein